MSVQQQAHLNSGNSTTKDQCMNIMSSFIGVNGFQVHHMANDVVFIANSVA